MLYHCIIIHQSPPLIAMCEKACNTKLQLLEELKKANEKLQALATLAKTFTDMRAAQKRYFKTRSTRDLQESKDLERRVDVALENSKHLFAQQADIFGE